MGKSQRVLQAFKHNLQQIGHAVRLAANLYELQHGLSQEDMDRLPF